ncbi:hypothetical protein J6590_105735, partial [Homalodisca vitripennis]
NVEISCLCGPRVVALGGGVVEVNHYSTSELTECVNIVFVWTTWWSRGGVVEVNHYSTSELTECGNIVFVWTTCGGSRGGGVVEVNHYSTSELTECVNICLCGPRVVLGVEL